MGAGAPVPLLATLAGPQILKYFERGQEEIALAKCKEYHDAVVSYRLFDKLHRWPESLEDLREPLNVRVARDPWGRRYRLVIEGDTVRVWCDGRDQAEGTDDDIVYVPEDED